MTTTIEEATLPEKILLAAFQLEEGGQSPFSAEALIVTSWKNYPRTFGLKGYAEQYPDANKVLASIMGEKGLARRGWLVKMGQKLYALTREGRQIVRRLRQEEEPPASTAQSITLSGEHDKLIQVLFGSTAWQKLKEGHKGDLNFADACRFWNITEHISVSVLDQRLQLVTQSLHEIERQLGSGGVQLSNGRKISTDEMTLLVDLHKDMEERFDRHLMLLRNRAGRR
jgi:hypothetical protein